MTLPIRVPNRSGSSLAFGHFTDAQGRHYLCYTGSMKRRKQRRSGATETFSVSVDRETKRALRTLADREFGGNLSALVTDFAEEARRRMAAGEYLARHRMPKLTVAEAAALEEQIAQEIASSNKRARRRRVA